MPPIVFIFIVLSGTGYGQGPLIAVTESWPPFRINSEGTKFGFSGIDMDILEGLEKELNIEIVVQRHPFARALEMIRTGEADLTPGIARTEKRSLFIAYVPTSYYAVTPVFYTQKNHGHLVQTYNDLYTFKIGYSLHSAYFEPFNSDDKLQKMGISTEEQLIKMVASGRIDLIIGTNPNLAYDIKQYGFKDKVEEVRYRPDSDTPVYIGLSKKHENTELQQKIDAYLKKITANGALNRILDQYK